MLSPEGDFAPGCEGKGVWGKGMKRVRREGSRGGERNGCCSTGVVGSIDGVLFDWLLFGAVGSKRLPRSTLDAYFWTACKRILPINF